MKVINFIQENPQAISDIITRYKLIFRVQDTEQEAIDMFQTMDLYLNEIWLSRYNNFNIVVPSLVFKDALKRIIFDGLPNISLAYRQIKFLLAQEKIIMINDTNLNISTNSTNTGENANTSDNTNTSKSEGVNGSTSKTIDSGTSKGSDNTNTNGRSSNDNDSTNASNVTGTNTGTNDNKESTLGFDATTPFKSSEGLNTGATTSKNEGTTTNTSVGTSENTDVSSNENSTNGLSDTIQSGSNTNDVNANSTTKVNGSTNNVGVTKMSDPFSFMERFNVSLTPIFRRMGSEVEKYLQTLYLPNEVSYE